ncbi:MAG: ABC transporter permease [Gemmatimonadota bacterium]|nr:ABC transporter permease [Gemmatimonadota bacterium]MDH4350783.1 ABC transporter permease [Gemmatimonadota bacterium]MDH5196689.1 ABC transporter permease [Gemmatimonadota bacterium]
MIGLPGVIAGRYLRSRRSARFVSLITFIATGGITIGVMALIVVLGVMNGLQHELREKILIGSPHLRLLTFGEGIRMDAWEVVLPEVRDDPDVVAAAPFVLTQGLFSAGHDYHEGAYILGIETDTGAAAVTRLPETFVRGDLTFATTRDDVDGGIVLGRRMAERFSAFPGATVTAISPGGSRFNASVGAFVPRFWTFEVTGYFETGMYEYDNAYAVLPREVAQEFAGLGNAVTGLEIRLNDPARAEAVGRRLEEKFGYPYRALDWQSQNASLFSALQLEKLAMGLVLLLIVLVAAFNIVSTLTMIVTDKTREIGILRAMGMPGAAIRRIFILQGTIIGLIGTVLGMVLGLVLARVIDGSNLIQLDPTVYFISRIPVRVDPLDVAIVMTASLIVAVTATLHPARRAAALHPVDAIRHE